MENKVIQSLQFKIYCICIYLRYDLVNFHVNVLKAYLFTKQSIMCVFIYEYFKIQC